MHFRSVLSRSAKAVSLGLTWMLFTTPGVHVFATQSPGKPAKESKAAPATKDQKTQPQPGTPAQTQPPRRVGIGDRENVTLSDVNVEITLDRRVIIMMAALNVAGYDYESGNRQLSALRKQVREDLQATSPALVTKLRNYFESHRNGKSDSAAVAPYLTLALSVTDAPAFTLDVPAERLQEDVREILDFALLLQEFYQAVSFSKIAPKYVNAYMQAANTYGPAAVYAVSAVISYLHTEPVLELAPTYVSRARPQAQPKRDANLGEPVVGEKRIRKFVILPDLLNATGAANLRAVRDTYYLLLGPTSEPNVEAIRRGFLAFVIEPLTDKAVREVTATREPLRKLLDSRGDKVDPEFKQRSAFFLITESLVRAIDVRMTVLGFPQRRNYAEIDGIYELSQAYERGSVLAFHFYDRMAAVDSVGINLSQYFGDLLQRIDYEREANRLDEYAQRLARYKQAKLEAAAAPIPTATIANADEQTVARILSADDLIKARRYDEAKVILEGVHRDRPNNARALFGLADVTSKKASQITDSDRLAEQLYAAVELYKQAAQNADPDSEKWIAQRSYVAAAKILSFLGENDDSGAALDLAIKLGESADKAAYEEAVKLKQAREQKQQKP